MSPTTEAADALVALGIPADLGAWARYNGLTLVAAWVERDALAGHGWHVHAVVGRTSPVQLADGALVGLAAVVEAIRETWEKFTDHAPMAQQMADAAHERAIAALEAA